MYKCELCDYTTNRKYNYERHVHTKHLVNIPNVIETIHNCEDEGHNCEVIRHNCEARRHNCEEEIHNCEAVTHKHVCINCGKICASKYSLQRHGVSCRENIYTIHCSSCQRTFSSKRTLRNHKKVCKISNKTQDVEMQGGTTINVSGNHNTINNTVNQIVNHYQLLVFPEDNDSFDFLIDHIEDKSMRKIINENRPATGFRKFIGEVLQNPANCIVRKSNPNVSHSKIHKGDGKWDYARDKYVYPTIAHHMTTAALSKVQQLPQKKINPVKKCDFIDYVDDINTDDSTERFTDVIEDIKILVINKDNKDV